MTEARKILIEHYQKRTLMQYCLDNNLDYLQVVEVAKLENWPRIAPPEKPQSPTIVNYKQLQQERRQRYAETIGNIIEDKIIPHIQELTPKQLLSEIDQIEKADKIVRRSYDLDKSQEKEQPINVNILAQGVQAFAVQTQLANSP